jgi:hypothetical protein
MYAMARLTSAFPNIITEQRDRSDSDGNLSIIVTDSAPGTPVRSGHHHQNHSPIIDDELPVVTTSPIPPSSSTSVLLSVDPTISSSSRGTGSQLTSHLQPQSRGGDVDGNGGSVSFHHATHRPDSIALR